MGVGRGAKFLAIGNPNSSPVSDLTPTIPLRPRCQTSIPHFTSQSKTHAISHQNCQKRHPRWVAHAHMIAQYRRLPPPSPLPSECIFLVKLESPLETDVADLIIMLTDSYETLYSLLPKMQTKRFKINNEKKRIRKRTLSFCSIGKFLF